jgi:hypothetical protein
MSSSQSGEGEIRKNIIEADLVDCMVALTDEDIRKVANTSHARRGDKAAGAVDRLTQDYTRNSPSTAAGVLLGRAAAGRVHGTCGPPGAQP